MDRPVIIIDAPELDDKTTVCVQNFLHELLLAFEGHYLHQLKRAHQHANVRVNIPGFNDEDPF